jgi:hypothetical protein
MPQDEMLGLQVEVARRLTDYREELAKVRSEVAQLRTRIVILERLANEVLRQRLPRQASR